MPHEIRMVEIAGKPDIYRRAAAEGRIKPKEETIERIQG
ncbi:MAG TPA: cyclic pyranopterin monophosphate synthase MoaC, partial [Candidatus Bathyarchaeota archaeon]|nr:cyclic pyranopterin monophosphate synthase MoaC [Candidatus Bathyarchaeota archaeon]